MAIFKQTANIPTVASSVANIGIFAGLVPPVPGASISLTLNGSMSGGAGQVSFISSGYASGLSISSLLNVSASVFTVIGTFNDTIITEMIVGPNGNTVYTNNLFHTVTSISATGGGVASAFTIGSNCNIAVMLPDNGRIGYSNYNYSVLLNSLTAAGVWAAGGAIIYGISGIIPSSLKVTNLTYTTRDSNYFSIPVTGAALAGFTQLQLNNGVNVQTNYPYGAVIVYLAVGINTTPVFIEISQT